MGQQVSKITTVILKAIALAMSVAVVVLNILEEATPETSLTLLAIALLAVTLGTFIGVKEPD